MSTFSTTNASTLRSNPKDDFCVVHSHDVKDSNSDDKEQEELNEKQSRLETLMKKVSGGLNNEERVEVNELMISIETNYQYQNALLAVQQRREQADLMKVKNETLILKSLGVVNEAESVVLLFLFSTANKMNLYIESLKNQVVSMVEKLRNTHKQGSIHIGFQLYRDGSLGDDLNELEVYETLPFTSSLAKFKTFLRTFKAKASSKSQSSSEKGSGRDRSTCWKDPEDFVGALRKVSRMNWGIAGDKSTRVLIHMCDMPSTIKSPISGGTSVIDPFPYLSLLKDSLRVDYYFGKVNASTDLMVEKMNWGLDDEQDVGLVESEAAHPCEHATIPLESCQESGSYYFAGPYITTKPMGDVTSIGRVILNCLRFSIMKNVEYLFHGQVKYPKLVLQEASDLAGKDTEENWEVSLDKSFGFSLFCPKQESCTRGTSSTTDSFAAEITQTWKQHVDWSKLPVHPTTTFDIEPIVSMKQIMKPGGLHMVTYDLSSENIGVKIHPTPLHKTGRDMETYQAMLCVSRDDAPLEIPYMIKKFKLPSLHMMKSNYQQQVEILAIANYFADGYNCSTYKPSNCLPLYFLKTHLLEVSLGNGKASGKKESRENCEYFTFQTRCDDRDVSNFHRYTNNCGHFDSDYFDESMARFSKYTFDISGGYLMIVGLKGYRKNNISFIFGSCPVVLCEDVTRFGESNLGVQAMHRCLSSIHAYLNNLT